MTDSASEDLPPAGSPAPGRYRHFKGNEYELLSLARHSETMGWHAVYRRVNDPESIWVRPLEMWSETVDRPDGTRGLRFAPID
ncbi:MAG: DUF1653 domain-containing protein [Solirubrobacteraceae bacterium]|nr:DUF1653 domain-containing protein [Solirubrobacteraceae bacterium]